MSQDPTHASKYLSYLLRHNPAAAGITLDHAGWTDIDTLLIAVARHGNPIDRDTLNLIVHSPGKRRFEIQDNLIRAASGHTIGIDLGLEPAIPPRMLYHGTVQRFLDRIRAEGLKPVKRSHVHLSEDPAAAAEVGARRGSPIVLAIDTRKLHENGHLFYRTTHGVWLTPHVPTAAITLHASSCHE